MVKQICSQHNALEADKFTKMKKHVKIYFKENGYSQADIGLIPCEIQLENCQGMAVDICHIDAKGIGGKDENENLVAGCRNCHEQTEGQRKYKQRLKEIAKNRIEARKC